MRNRTITYAVLALMTLGFAGCQQEDDFTPQGGDDEIRISFTTEAIQTRVNTLGTGDKWENDDQILVVNATNDVSATFTASVAGESVSWTQDKKLYWEGEGENTLLASYPAGCEYGTFTLPTDQSDETKLKSADYMNAYCVSSKSQGAVTFAMKHRMAMITATYTVENEFVSGTDLSKAEVYSTSSTATFDSQEGTMSVDEVGQWVSAYIRDGKFTAIVMPGDYKAGDELMHVTVNGATEPLIVKVKEDFTLGEGEHRAFTLSVGKEYIEADENTTPETLQNAISEKLAAGETDIRIKLAEDADETMFAAITAALAADGIAEGSIDLTISGAKTVPEEAFDAGYGKNPEASAVLRSVTLTDATEIGELAFFMCGNLIGFSAPNAITISDFVFEDCVKLAEVYLPSVQTLGGATFRSCYALKTISLPECIDLGGSTFVWCEALETVYAPKVTKLGPLEFMQCTSLTKVTLGSVESVNQYYVDQSNGLFSEANDTQNIELVLSSEQKVMTFDSSTKYWTATETDYNDSEDHNNKSFIGYTFKSVTLQ